MQRAVFDAGWPGLWPVQDEAIAAILQTAGHALLLGDTAGGKTEAAFLPILSLPPAAAGFTVLYVSPLRALLNDQLERLRALGTYAGLPAHLWHSDVARSRKQRTQQTPGGILLTTPESLEAMCVHRALYLPLFFSDLRFVVIDELHAFLGTARGAQLHSLLRRIARYAAAPPRRVGLSATIGTPAAAAAWLGAPCAVCAAPGPRKGTRLHLRYAPDGDVTVDLRALTNGRKALIFCNSRARVEHLTYTLGQMAGDASAYLPHHGSLHLRERAHAEGALRAGARASIVCTSTLELGIDIGAVDLVVQVDCTSSAAGLRQRLGRSGRAPGADRVGQIYATGEPQLLQAVAVVELLRRGWAEPPDPDGPLHNVRWQQALSEGVERGQVDGTDLHPALLAHMLAQGHLEARGQGYGPGWRGEALAQRRDFYAAFQSDEAYELAAGPRVLGRLPPLPIYRPGTPLIFAGRLWTVDEVDHARRRIEVSPGAAGHPPVFTSGAAKVHGGVRAEMAAVLCCAADHPYLDRAGAETLRGLRRQFSALGLGPALRPAVTAPGWSEVHAFAGDRVAATLALLLQLESGLVWEVTAYGGVATPQEWPALLKTLEAYARDAQDPQALTRAALALVPDDALVLPKFAQHLPPALHRSLHAASELDVPGALQLLRTRSWAAPPRIDTPNLRS